MLFTVVDVSCDTLIGFYNYNFPEKMVGELPKAYNKAVHGPYDPAIFYGKRDVPLGQVKLQDVPSWFSRRNLSPTAMGQAMSRAYWRYVALWEQQMCLFKYLSSLSDGITSTVYLSTAGSLRSFRWIFDVNFLRLIFLFKMSVGFSALFYLMNYNSIKTHRCVLTQ